MNPDDFLMGLFGVKPDMTRAVPRAPRGEPMSPSEFGLRSVFPTRAAVPDELVNETISLLEREEGWRPRSYQDSGGVWTIGYGRTGPDVGPKTTTTREAERNWVNNRVRDDAMWLMNRRELEPQPELLSAIYNLGRGGFKKTGAEAALRAGDLRAAGDSLVANGSMAYNEETKRMEPSVRPRRQREAESLARRRNP